MSTNAQLLRRYAEENSEEAFAELVRRHLDLVYSAALRQVGGDSHCAQDVAQVVFTTLARKAAALSQHPALAGWLYTATRHASAKAWRAEIRRRRREQKAHAMHEPTLPDPTTPPDWDRVRPVLDAAMADLGERDREAVVLRFFARQPFAEIGAALAVTEDAARMRVERALEKLRAQLARRGVTSTTAALSLALGNHAVAAAPTGLAASVSGVALGAAASGGSANLLGIVDLMTKTKLAAGLAAALALTGMGMAVREYLVQREVEGALAVSRRDYAALQAQVDALAQRAQRAAVDRDHADQALAAARTARDANKVISEKALAADALTATEAVAPERPANPLVEGRAFLQRHPEVKEALDIWGRATVRAQWAAFFKAHAFTEEQIEEFTRLSLGITFLPGAEPDGKTLVLFTGLGLSLEERERRLAAIFDAETMRDYRDAVRLRPTRDFTDQLTGALCFTDTPLRPEQARALIPLLDRHRVAAAGDAPYQFRWETLLPAAATVLSEPQLAALSRLHTEDRARQAWDKSMEQVRPDGTLKPRPEK